MTNPMNLAQPLPDDVEPGDEFLRSFAEAVRWPIYDVAGARQVWKKVCALLPAAQPAPALAEEDRELVDGLRGLLEKVPDLPAYVSEFERGAGGDDRVIMGDDGFLVARLIGRSAEEHEALAELIISAVNALPRLLSLATRPGEVPVGWKLVPVEATEDMAMAGCAAPRSEATTSARNTLDRQAGIATDIYRAMITAAPAPEGGRGGHGDG